MNFENDFLSSFSVSFFCKSQVLNMANSIYKCGTFIIIFILIGLFSVRIQTRYHLVRLKKNLKEYHFFSKKRKRLSIFHFVCNHGSCFRELATKSDVKIAILKAVSLENGFCTELFTSNINRNKQEKSRRVLVVP